MTNTLYFGDNLNIMSRKLNPESIDVIYLDPPFNSKQDYNIIIEDPSDPDRTAAIKAFKDTWRWDEVAAQTYQTTVIGGGPGSDVLEAFEKILKPGEMLAYLSMMTPRLVKLKELLKPTGSIFLHCDPTASHYLKVLMDSIYGPKRFKNEIVWAYSGSETANKHFPKKHDVIFWYGKTKETYFKMLFDTWSDAQLKRYNIIDEDGTRWANMKGKIRKLGPGKRYNDVWNIPCLSATAKERLGYPTQKPEELLNRIIQCSCPDGGILLDPFCGCGTSTAVASRLNITWIGIDISLPAIRVIQKRLNNIGSDYTLDGIPTDLTGFKFLADQPDKYPYQNVVLEMLGAQYTKKKGADGGIDGVISFSHPDGHRGKIICSIKGGAVTTSQVRDLRGAVNRERADFGVFATLELPTRPMREEAASGESYIYNNQPYQKIQILTIAEMVDGKRPNIPTVNNIILPKQVFQRTL
jgi:site-specific DNA-methyltransferase (adenine-specific)